MRFFKIFAARVGVCGSIINFDFCPNSTANSGRWIDRAMYSANSLGGSETYGPDRKLGCENHPGMKSSQFRR